MSLCLAVDSYTWIKRFKKVESWVLDVKGNRYLFGGLSETTLIYWKKESFFHQLTETTSHLTVSETSPERTCNIQNKCECIFVICFITRIKWQPSSCHLNSRDVLNFTSIILIQEVFDFDTVKRIICLDTYSIWLHYQYHLIIIRDAGNPWNIKHRTAITYDNQNNTFDWAYLNKRVYTKYQD